MSDEKSSSEDGLPAGWTVEVKVRKNGKKDKCYTDPSNKLKFNSKVEVLRHLNSIKIESPRAEEKKTGASEPSAVVEKVGAEGLPPGWRVEMRVRKNGGKNRTDAYYIDPASGYIFRSMKDVFRYLETGALGRLALKPKDEGFQINADLGDDKSPSTAEAGGQKVADSGIDRRVTRNESLKLVTMKDEQIDKSNRTDLIQLSGHASDPRSKDPAMSSSNLPQTNGLEEREGKSDSSGCGFVSPPAVGVLTEQKPSENVGKENMSRTTQHGISKLNDKKGPDVPRRASKRLAGISVDTSPVLKTNNRASRVVARQSGEAEVGSVENGGDLASPGELIRKETQENMADEKLGCPIIKPIEKLLSNPEGHRGQVKTDGLEQREGKGNSSACDFVSAPSVKTLAEQKPSENVVKVNESRKARHGICRLNDKKGPDLPRRASKRLVTIKAETLAELKTNNGARNSGEVEAGSAEHIGNLVSPKEHVRTAETEENMVDEKRECPTIMPSEELSIREGHAGLLKTYNKPESPIGFSLTDSWMEVDPCIEFAIKTLTGAIPIGDENTADENGSIALDLPAEKPGSPVLPFGDLWTDPCIEFAVKTLKGEIPVENNLQIQDYFQKQLGSSKPQGHNGFTIPNISLGNNSCQDHLSSQHFHSTENPFDINNRPR